MFPCYHRPSTQEAFIVPLCSRFIVMTCRLPKVACVLTSPVLEPFVNKLKGMCSSLFSFFHSALLLSIVPVISSFPLLKNIFPIKNIWVLGSFDIDSLLILAVLGVCSKSQCEFNFSFWEISAQVFLTTSLIGNLAFFFFFLNVGI